MIKDKLIDLIERTYNRDGPTYRACYDINEFFYTSEKPKEYHVWSSGNVCNALNLL